MKFRLNISTALVCATVHLQMTMVQSNGNPQIIVDHTQTFQNFYGCGASWTDTAAWIMNGYRSNPSTDPRTLSDSERDEIIQALFSKSGDGIGLDVLRQPMGTSDFRWSDYTYEDTRGSFSIAADQSYIIPTILQTLQENPNLKVMALPWSAPAWAKDNNSLNGGGLKSNDNTVLQDYHDYFVDFVDAYTAEGIPIWAISVQNEPQHGAWNYPTMTLSTTEHGNLIQGVRAALDAAQHDGIKVVGYDHNWDTPDYVRNTLTGNTAARAAVSAIAFHCYGGDVSTQSQIKAEFPELEIWFTECTEFGDLSSFNGDFRWALRNLVIGTTQNWASTVLEWNLVLMEGGGPKISGGCENCRGLIDVQDGGYRKNPAYYALGHLSKFVQSDGVGGATKRIHSSEPTPNSKTLAMLNPDGSSFVIILNDGSPDLTLDLDWMAATCTVIVPSWSAVTVFRPAGSNTMQVWRTTDQQSQTRLTYTEDIVCVPNSPPMTPFPIDTPSMSPTATPKAPSSSPSKAPTAPPSSAPSKTPTTSPSRTPSSSPTPLPSPMTTQSMAPSQGCTLAKENESCVNGSDCCSGSCSGGNKNKRVCLPGDDEQTPNPVSSPVESPVSSPTDGGSCSKSAGESCKKDADCCPLTGLLCSGGAGNQRKCYQQ